MNEFFNSQAFAYMRDQRSGETNLDAAYLFIAQDRFNRALRHWNALSVIIDGRRKLKIGIGEHASGKRHISKGISQPAQ